MIWKSKKSLQPNPLGLAEETATAIVPELDRHVAALMVLFHQYQKHHWLVVGPQFMELHKVLENYYEDARREADLIAERITALGGIPTSNPADQARLSYVSHEEEGQFRVREMLELDRSHETDIAKGLRDSIRLALDLGDFGTEHILKKVLREVEERAHHLDNFLEHDSLEIGGRTRKSSESSSGS